MWLTNHRVQNDAEVGPEDVVVQAHPRTVQGHPADEQDHDDHVWDGGGEVGDPWMGGRLIIGRMESDRKGTDQ